MKLLPSLLGATAACVTAALTGGTSAFTPAVAQLINSISGNIASEPLSNLFYKCLAKLPLSKNHPDKINHDLQIAFERAVVKSIDHIEIRYLEYYEKNESASIFKLHKPKILAFFDSWKVDIKTSSTTSENDITPYILKTEDLAIQQIIDSHNLITSNDSSGFKEFIKENLRRELQIAFDEELKKNTEAFRAFSILFDRKIYAEIKESNKKIDSVNNKIDTLLNIIENGSNKFPSGLHKINILNNNQWVVNLRQEILKYNVKVGSKPWSIFQHYGWLIETFLQKMASPIAQQNLYLKFSYLIELYYSSIRYLTYIQISLIFKESVNFGGTPIESFLQSPSSDYKKINLLGLLLTADNLIPSEKKFIPELENLILKLSDSSSTVFELVSFLQKGRNDLINQNISESTISENYVQEYFICIIYWLRSISFLSKYRLISIKDIKLQYSLGSKKVFLHHFGELHGIYSETQISDDDYNILSVENFFTYNHSILLFKGANVEDSLASLQDESNYLSLSPLIIDYSVFMQKETQTPEIYYFRGKLENSYHYAQYKNELPHKGAQDPISNKYLQIREEYNQVPRFDKLYPLIKSAFTPNTSRDEIK